MITIDDLNSCPEPVRRYLTKSGVVGKHRKTFAHITHTGEFRMKAKQKWFPIKGDYKFQPEARIFTWKAAIKLFPFVFISVKDEYKKGIGRSLVKFESLFTMAHQTGPEASESSLGRLLVEFVLIPTALVPSQTIRWEAMDSNQARVILNDHKFQVSAVFEFDDQGQLVKTSIERFGNFDGKMKKNLFVCELSNFKLFEDLLIPTDITGSWAFTKETFHWLHFKISSAHFE